MFSPENANKLQDSFSDFCKRPENRSASEAAQRHELKQGLKVKEALSWGEFEAKVLSVSRSPEWLAFFLGYVFFLAEMNYPCLMPCMHVITPYRRKSCQPAAMMPS